MTKRGDHFSGHAAEYAKARPTYPAELFNWLAEVAPGRACCWDAGCGNGQASVALATQFKRVVATDISPQQIAAAMPRPNIEYAAAGEGGCPLPDRSADLVTVAQAAHWFDLPTFLTECRRVLKPGGIVAVWGYGLTRITPAIDAEVLHFYTEVVGPYWPSGREHLDNEYRTLDLPLKPIKAPPFAMELTWDLPALLAYLGTWSAVQRYIKAKGDDPIPALTERLRPLWGDAPRLVQWPLYLRIGTTP
jgi:SAM-dependent methyltransferase